MGNGPSSNICDGCPTGCVTCFGSLTTTCYTCNGALYKWFYNNTCSETCPDGQYKVSGTINVCLLCNFTCSKCVDSNTKCLSCVSGFYLLGA